MNTADQQALEALQDLSRLTPQQLLTYQAYTASAPPQWLRLAVLVHHSRQRGETPPATPAQLLLALRRLGKSCAEWREDENDPDSDYITWHCGDPQTHLGQVAWTTLLALGMTEGIAPPRPGGDDADASVAMALPWLSQAAVGMSHTPAASADWNAKLTPIHGTQEASVRVLFKAGASGALGHLRLRAVHQPGAHLCLAPMPASLCLLLDADFGRSLQTVTQYLRHTLQSPTDGGSWTPLADIALAWDLAPTAGDSAVPSFSSLHGDSAGAAFTCAALLALAPYAPAALRSHVLLAAPLLHNAFITAAIDEHGALRPVGGIGDKAQGFGPLAQALLRGANGAGMNTLYLAKEQSGTETLKNITPQPCHSVADILSHLAQRASPLSADQQAFLAQGFADPEQLSQALQDDARRDETEQLLNRLVDDVHNNPVGSVQQAAIQGVARWVRQAGGRLRAQFVPLRVQPDSAEAKRLPKAALDPVDHLPQLLQLADGSSHHSYLLKGLPGAGKSVLLRRHMLECCEQLLRPAVSGEPHGSATWELPIYLPMDAFPPQDPTNAPDDSPGDESTRPWWAEQAKTFTRNTLSQQGWTAAMVNALLQPSGSANTLAPARFLLDGVNELPMPKGATYARSERAECVVKGFLDAFSPRARKPLLSVRSHHFSVPDALPVEVMPWNKQRIHDYLRRYFGEPLAAQLWLQFKDDTPLLDLCSRPMHMHMQCELIEGGYAPLATDRASLYLAHLWLRLRRALGHFGQGDTRQKRDKALELNNELLTQQDREQINQTQPGRIGADDLRELPTRGWLLRGLMQQAEHQYWADTEAGKDKGERCTVSVRIKDIHLKDTHGGKISEDLRDRWIRACEALGLLEKEKDGANRVKFSHQSWGEFFASLRLLDTPPDELERQVNDGVPGAQAKWDRAMVRPFTHLNKPVSAEAERQALRERVNRRWAPALPLLRRLPLQTLPGFSGRWMGPVDLDKFKADPSVALRHQADAAVMERYTSNGWIHAGLLHIDLEQRQVWAQPDAYVRGLQIAAKVGLGSDETWADQPVAWRALIIEELQGCFEALVWRHLRAGDGVHPGFGEEAERELREELGHMTPPPTSDVQEVFNLALQGLPLEQAKVWLQHWLAQPPHPQAWRVLAPAALALRPRLEPPELGRSGVTALGCWSRPAPLLEHLRRWLLLASIDAGPAAKPRAQAAQLLAALDAPTPGLPAPIAATWRGQRQAALAAPGLDLLLRLQAGLWLGELGDTLRFEREIRPVEGRERVGIRLKAAHWAQVPASGPGATHRIGSPRNNNSQPVWTLPDRQSPGLCLPEARFAHIPAVVMQWQAYMDDLRAQGQPARELWAMGQTRWNNPLQPITSLTWFEAQAFTAWAAPLHEDLFPELNVGPTSGPTSVPKTAQLALPTEVQHEAALRFDPAHPHPDASAPWPHDPTDTRDPGNMPPDLFNHGRTRWGAPAPVGVFSAALTPTGIEAMGNVWTWCGNAKTPDYQATHRYALCVGLNPAQVQEDLDKGKSILLALRGGSFNNAAGTALAAYRNRIRPVTGVNDIGLRWQMSRPISEP